MTYAKKVLIAIPVLLVGGTEIQTLTLIRVLINAGYQVIVCCYYEFDASVVNKMEIIGARIILLRLDRTDGMMSLVGRLRRLFKEINPDIVHVQYIAPGLIPVISAKLARIKTVFATVHQPGRIYGCKEKLFLRIAALLCTAFFCNSKAVEESWFGDSEIFDPNKSYKKRKHFTIYNAIDIDHIEKILQDSDPEKIKSDLGLNDKSMVGVVGRLRWEKGQDILIAAMPEVIKKIPNAILLVVGDGPDREKLENKAKKLGIERNIIWKGKVEYDEVIRLYSVMDVVAVPSRFEGFGLSAAEAMVAGVPVVCSQVDGLNEIIEDRQIGYLVHTDDIESLAKSLIYLLQDKQKSFNITKKGKEYVRKKYSLEKYTASIISVYEYHLK